MLRLFELICPYVAAVERLLFIGHKCMAEEMRFSRTDYHKPDSGLTICRLVMLNPVLEGITVCTAPKPSVTGLVKGHS